MKKKIKISLFVFIVIGVVVLNITYKNKNEVTKTKRKSQSSLTIMIKGEGASDYTKSTSKDIPKGNYVLNEEKTHCENNGKILSYDNTTGKISFSFIGSDRCYLYFDYEVPKRIGYEAILLDNGLGVTTVEEAKQNIENKGTPDFSTVVTINEGMYAAKDDLGTSYYFRGAVDNNWIKYGQENGKDIYWRIIRINGDNTIRMIYSGTIAPTSDTAIIMPGTGTQITIDIANTFSFNNSYNDPVYVGYMYTLGEQHGNSTSSTIKTIVDNWYKTTTLATAPTTKSLVADQIFCNDRSAATSKSDTPGEINGSMSTSTTYYYGAYIRLIANKTPKLTCTTVSDRFTVKASTGNGALDYPVGLITADEVAMAGDVWGIGSKTSNSYLNTKQHSWSGSPYFFNGSIAFEFYGISTGLLLGNGVNYTIGIRPVISLSADVKLSGDGTWNNVYTVS